jgi:hypothetical protein
MKKIILLFFGGLMSLSLMTQQKVNEWPVLKHYDQNHLSKIVFPIGGIGTGTVNIGGRGDLRQWEIMNIPGKQNPGGPNRNDQESISPVFCLFTKMKDGTTITKSLTGPLEYYQYEAMMGQPTENHGLPRFREASFDAAYPFGQVNLSDKDVPLDVTIRAFNPLIPGDADASGIPIVVLRFVLTNKTNQSVSASICGIMDNFIGIDGSKQKTEWKGEQILYGASKNKNEFCVGQNIQGIYMTSEGVDKNDAAWGTIALTTDSKENISFKTSTSPLGWGSEILSFWDDFSVDGKLTNTPYSQPDKPTGALATLFEVPGNGSKEISFYITWHFPNRFAWSEKRVGNYYTLQYENAWDVILKTHDRLPDLEKKSLEFGDNSGTADPLRGWKMTTWEGGLRVPFIARWPGKLKGNRVSNKILSTMDLLPTLASLGGAELPKDRILNGYDASSFLLGETDTSPREDYLYYDACLLTGVRKNQWKLVLPRPENPDGTGWWGRMIEEVKTVQLYNMDTDLSETTNLADKHPDVIARLMRRIEQARKELGDINITGTGARFFDDGPRRLEADLKKKDQD